VSACDSDDIIQLIPNQLTSMLDREKWSASRLGYLINRKEHPQFMLTGRQYGVRSPI